MSAYIYPHKIKHPTHEMLATSLDLLSLDHETSVDGPVAREMGPIDGSLLEGVACTANHGSQERGGT